MPHGRRHTIDRAGLPQASLAQEAAGLKPDDILVSLDGVEIEFQMAPGTEAPAEMHFYFPKFRALCIAENATHNLHNLHNAHNGQNATTERRVGPKQTGHRLR